MSTPGIPGFEEISALATKYSPQQIQLMAAQGMIDLGTATRAKFLQDRIAAEVARSKMPITTVAQDTMAPPQPTAAQDLVAPPQAATAGLGALAPAMPAQPAPEMGGTGVDTLPVPEQEYADGGIVAFAGPEGSFVSGPTGFDEDFLTATGLSASDVSSLDKSIVDQLRERALGPIKRSEEEEANIKFLKDQPARSEAAKERAKTNAILGLASNLLASKSPRFLQAAGEAGQKTLPQFTRAQEAIEESDVKNMAARAALAKGERDEELKMKELAARMYGYEQQKEASLASAAKTATPDRYAEIWYQAFKDDPKYKGVSREQMMLMGYQDLYARQGEAAAKAQAAGVQAGASATKAATDLSEAQMKAWSDAYYAPGNSQLRKDYNAAPDKGVFVREWAAKNMPAAQTPAAVGPAPRAQFGKQSAAPAAPAAAAPAQPQINTGRDLTSSRLTGKDLAAQKEKFGNDPAINKRLEAAEAEAKRAIAAEKNPKKVTSQQDFDNLPEGTVYVLPNGEKGVKGFTYEPTAPAAAAPQTTTPTAKLASTTAVPMPAEKSKLKKGTVYSTMRGPATWDGKQFIPVR